MKGYRCFNVKVDGDEVFLRPAVKDIATPLEYPTLAATCTSAHRAPTQRCACGFYAYKELGGGADYHHGDGAVMAEVWGHGKIEEHTFGWRAERMQIRFFFWPLCSNCQAPAARAFRLQSKAWPTNLEFACEDCEPSHETQRDTYGALQMDFGVVFSVVNESLDHLLYRLSQRFQAGVYAPEESLKVLAENPGWRDRMSEVGGVQRRWNQWKANVQQAQAAAKFQGQRAQQKMDELVAQVPPTPWYER